MTVNEYLKEHILIMDGAMGTYYERQADGKKEYAEQAGIEEPHIIKRIHREYIEAGAKMIRTNTFAVNHLLFSKKECKNAICKGVENVKSAIEESGKSVFLAASIGPIRYEEDDFFDCKKEYLFLIDCFLEQGVDNFVFETFGQYDGLGELAEYIKKKKKDAFVLIQFSLYKTGYTGFGIRGEKLLKRMYDNPFVDATGYNCGIGVSHMQQLLSKATLKEDAMISAIPNSSYQTMPRGRRIYYDNTAYFGEQMQQILDLGVNIIGGCCGTTPEHIKELAKRYKNAAPLPKEKMKGYEHSKQVIKIEGKPDFLRKIEQKEKIYVVELDPPFHSNPEKLLEGAKLCEEKGIDVITIADSPMAKARSESFLTSAYLSKKVSIPVMPHISCRDRNLIALRAGLMGSYMNGNRQILVITGDPVDHADRDKVSAVFDMNSIRLMGYIKNMNEEMYQNSPLYYGGALDYSGANVDGIIKKMKKKMEQGCSYFLTQPVYSKEDRDRVKLLKEATNAKILVGIMPLVSYKNALFMKEEMPGIHVPEDIVACFHENMTRAQAENISKEICIEIAKETKDYADGYYFMTPFNRVQLVTSIIDAIKKG